MTGWLFWWLFLSFMTLPFYNYFHVALNECFYVNIGRQNRQCLIKINVIKNTAFISFVNICLILMFKYYKSVLKSCSQTKFVFLLLHLFLSRMWFQQYTHADTLKYTTMLFKVRVAVAGQPNLWHSLCKGWVMSHLLPQKLTTILNSLRNLLLYSSHWGPLRNSLYKCHWGQRDILLNLQEQARVRVRVVVVACVYCWYHLRRLRRRLNRRRTGLFCEHDFRALIIFKHKDETNINKRNNKCCTFNNSFYKV